MLKINEYFYHLQGKDLFVHKNHYHNEIEFIQVINGNGVVLKNDKTYILKPDREIPKNNKEIQRQTGQ